MNDSLNSTAERMDFVCITSSSLSVMIYVSFNKDTPGPDIPVTSPNSPFASSFLSYARYLVVEHDFMPISMYSRDKIQSMIIYINLIVSFQTEMPVLRSIW
jgi:hypothetical protein